MPSALTGHDRDAAADDRSPGAGARAQSGPDLASALARLRLDGAIFLRGVYSEAWAYESVPGADASALLAPGAPRVILFHVVASGRAWIEVDGEERLYAGAGDVIVLPYGDTHRMGGSGAATCTPLGTLIAPPPWSEMPVVQLGGGGAQTELVCGYLTCEDPLFDPKLRALPPIFVVSPPQGAARDWVRAGIDYALSQTSMVQTSISGGHLEGPVQIPESLLVEVLKLHLASAPAAQQGWLRAIRDPLLGRALAAIHREPECKWTVDSLAREANTSGSVLDERFREVLGLAPIRYLAGWRMHVAGDLLRSSDLPVAVVARRVGYDAEEAFSRAFKRTHGESPSVWRTRRSQGLS
ncbi:AraC family transcriptional regulator [Nocardioides cavernaquae]|uniref:AraC family transcriptional regulator n=1 Tax=Nocardioides cavernaquae TaxID=2321396 RepID=A0A3A5HGF9_9ACTN|nr:AraC family transcriptional regulator [Nocardioides cavernaquae]RJS46817.1 AraC family transcriptional regulator [Nocardioides cavernaquae]